jgi:hypothetical protein
MKYILVQWPESQELMEIDGFEEYSSLAHPSEFGSCAYFVEEDWYNEEVKNK